MNKLISIFHDLDVLSLFLPLLTFFLGSILTCNMIFFFFLVGPLSQAERVMDTGDWRIQLQLDSRKRIVDKI